MAIKTPILASSTALALLLAASPTLAQDIHGSPPKVTLPSAPPRVYAPPKLPPDSQAIPKSRTTTTKKVAPSAPSSGPAVTPKQTAAQKAAAQATAAAKAQARVTGKTLQEKLSDLGYDPGPIDGIVGSKTLNAVFVWVSEIKDPDLQQRARTAAHSQDYGRLIEMMEVMDAQSSGGGEANEVASTPQEAPAEQPNQDVTQADAAPQPEESKEPEAEDGGGEPQFVEGFISKSSGDIDRYLEDLKNFRAKPGPIDAEKYQPVRPTKTLYTQKPEQNLPILRKEIDRLLTRIRTPLEQSKQRYLDRLAGYPDTIKDIEWEIAHYTSLKGQWPYHNEEGERRRLALLESAQRSLPLVKAKWAELESNPWTVGYIESDSFVDHNALNRDIETIMMLQREIANIEAQLQKDAAEAEPEGVAAVDNTPDPVEQERQEKIAQAQQDMDSFLANKLQAEAELRSLSVRIDLSSEEKARVSDGIKARLAFTESLLKEAQTKLAAEGAEFDGYDGKDMANFDPYQLTETDVELTRIAEKAKATERFYDEINLARKTIRDTTDGLDAATLQDKVTAMTGKLAGNAEEIDKVSEQIHNYAKNIRVVRKQGELERLAADAELAVINAKENLAYVRSVVNISKNADLVLLMGAGAGAALGIGGVTAAEAATAQAVMAGMDGTTSGIEGYSLNGLQGALKEGSLHAGKYYVPVNTYLAATDKKATKTSIALGVLSDTAILFTGVKAAKARLDKATAASAAVSRQSLSASEKVISDAARRAADKGDDLIANYQKARWQAEQARAPGMVNEAAESSFQKAVKAIDRSDEAKLALKARDSHVQFEFIKDQTQIIKEPAQAAFETNMRAMGWSEQAIRTEQIRNKSSAGTVGLDDDIRLLEPSILDTLDDGVTPRWKGPNDPALKEARQAFRDTLTRNGEKTSLFQWEEDAKAAMDKAYRDTAGYAAQDARVEMTTSVNAEAYSNVGLLTGEGGSAGWAEQTASVTQKKIRKGVEAAEAMGLGSKPGSTTLTGTALEAAATEAKVASRELLKDLVGKAMRAQPDVTIPPKMQTQLQILEDLSRGLTDPAVANRDLINKTGTTLAKTMETLGGQVEVLLKQK